MERELEHGLKEGEPGQDLDGLARTVIGAAIRVHQVLGPGLLESVYEAALCLELEMLDVNTQRQVEIPTRYRGRDLGLGFRADVIVEGQLLLELKAVDRLDELHLAQTLSYLKLLDWRLGLLLNFNALPLKHGIRRVINSSSH